MNIKRIFGLGIFYSGSILSVSLLGLTLSKGEQEESKQSDTIEGIVIDEFGSLSMEKKQCKDCGTVYALEKAIDVGDTVIIDNIALIKNKKTDYLLIIFLV